MALKNRFILILSGLLLLGGPSLAASAYSIFVRALPAKVASFKSITKNMGFSLKASLGNLIIQSRATIHQNPKFSAGALAFGVFACYDLLKNKIWAGALEELDNRQKFIIRPRVARMTKAIKAAHSSVAICRALENDLALKYPHTREKSSQQLKEELTGLSLKVDEAFFAINARKAEQINANLKKEHDAQEISQDCAYVEACQNFTKVFLPILQQHIPDLKKSGAGRPGSRFPYWRNIEEAIKFDQLIVKFYAKADISQQFRTDLASLEAQKPWSWLQYGWQALKKEAREFFS